jgi:hypothetical protein
MELKKGDIVRPFESYDYLDSNTDYRIKDVSESCVLLETLIWEEIDYWYAKERFKKMNVINDNDSTEDIASNPQHYKQGNIQVIDFIQDQKLNFALGNAIKYICRCNYKGTKEIDLKKAIQYLKFELKECE